MATDKQPKHQEFNSVLLEAIDESISQLLSPSVLKALYIGLKKRHDVTRDELPYRLETAYTILNEAFGFGGSRTISKMIAQKLYQKLDLRFENVPYFQLAEYVEMAKQKLAQIDS